jgi:RNA polymerase sigma-70 factor (ECF subfamily)
MQIAKIMPMVQAKPELELIADARNGDREAMAELFRRHHPNSIAVARRILPFQEEFLDAVQSAYLSAFLNFKSFRGESSFRTWITRIVINQCLMSRRRQGRKPVFLNLDDSEQGRTALLLAKRQQNPEDLAVRAETANILAHAVAKLPESMSEVFTRCGISGDSISDAAKALGLSVPATKTRLFRARSRMQAALKVRRVHFAAGMQSHC